MTFPCTLCKVNQDQLGSVTAGKEAESRNVREMAHLGHCTPGIRCPGCKMEIVDLVTNKNTQRAVSKPGDPPPRRPFMFEAVTHSDNHFNQKPGQSPLFPHLPLHRWSICVLHLSLRIVGMIWEHCVLP